MLSRILKGINRLLTRSGNTDSADNNDIPSLLFVHNIQRGTLKENLLSIELSSQPLFFSDRPRRLTGHVSYSFLHDFWQKGRDAFTENPPTAVLSVMPNDKNYDMVLELHSLTIDQDKLIYSANIISGQPLASFAAASLFIDAFPAPLNEQNANAIKPPATKVTGDAPATARGSLFIATSQALANAAHNATAAQQQTGITAQAATAMGVATLYSIDTASTGKAIPSVFTGE